MPKINRMRIVNFSYNNNNRHILDETFDFFGGENVLFSLVNGGGKSVLVQAMLQPILPRVSLLGRKIGDFFTGRNTPSYILLEWKLDDDAGYLLTGIGIMPSVSHSANEEEQTANIRYYTFFHEYGSGNALDIRQIPVTEPLGNHIKITSFNDFRKLMKKEQDKAPYRIGLYASDRAEQRVYESKLSSYGISADEWKDLIVRINEAEHGVSEVFTKCKTSKMVMEQWVIRYIEEVLNKSESKLSDHEKLQTMMSQVAEAKVENEHHLVEYEKIAAFIHDAGELYGDTQAILSALDEELHRKKRIRTSLHVLTTEEHKLKEESQELVNQSSQLQSGLRRIDLERKSLEIYGYLEELKNIENHLASLSDQLSQKHAALQAAEHSLTIQHAAERAKGIRGKEQRLAWLKEKLANAMKDEEKLAKDLNQVKYSLKLQYENVLEFHAVNLEALKETVELHEQRILALKKEIDRTREGLNDLNRRLGGLNHSIREFEEKEPAVLAELELELYRNPLIKELDPKDLESASVNLNGDITKIQNQMADRKQKMETVEEEIITAEKDKEALGNKQTEVNGEFARVAQMIEGYEEERDGVLSILERYSIPGAQLFDRETILNRIREKINSWKAKSLNLRIGINDVEKLLNGIEEGVSYLPSRLAALLNEHNLPCYTGERYLKELAYDRRKALLEQNPLLPYALILTEKEYNKIADLLKEEELSQIVPILRYQDREAVTMETGDAESKMRFFASAKLLTFDEENRNSYIQQLIENKEKMMAELEQAEAVLEASSRESQIVDQFLWTKAKADSLYQRRAELEALLQQLKHEEDQLRHKVEENRRITRWLIEVMDGLGKDLNAALQRRETFIAYVKSNEKYIEDLGSASVVNGEISRIQVKIDEMQEEWAEKEKQRYAAMEEVKSVSHMIRDTEEKYVKVKDAGTADVLDGTLNDLEGKLEAYLGKQTGEASSISEQMDHLIGEISSERKNLQKLGLAAEEYENVEYSEEKAQRLESDIKSLKAEVGKQESLFHKADKEKTASETKRDRAKAELNGEPLVPASEIRGEFDARSRELKEKIRKNSEREADIQRLFIRITELATKVDSRIPDILSIEADPAAIGTFADVEKEIETALKQYEDLVRSVDELIRSFHRKSNDLKVKYQQEQAGVVFEAFRSIQAQVESLSRTYDKYYYLSERLDSCIVRLREVLKIMEEKVLQLEHDQKDLVEHAFMEAKRIYHEIPKVSENSGVMIDGERKRILEITFDKIEDELAAKEKMAAYINDCLDTLTKLIKDQEDSSRNKRELEKFISTKELLNVISSIESYVVKAYKVDLNEKNRKMMRWEDIIVQNSGGEKFVAYFSLLVALISYSRGRSRDTLLKKEDSKVLIMDNPFGPITSGHLLKPMFDIAEKYNTQLICLSDIKQGSVIERFKLIYMVKIRQNMMHDEYLEFEPHTFGDLKADEKLENAHIYSSAQTGLFD